jgi:ZIP family zinc transporter
VSASMVRIADTMMPEAFEHGGKLVGLLTTLGFGLAFALTRLD